MPFTDNVAANYTEPRMLGLDDMCRKVPVTLASDEAEWKRLCDGDSNLPGDPAFCINEIPRKCWFSQKPIDFIYDRQTDQYDLDRFRTDS